MQVILNAILTFTNWVWGIPMLIAIAGGRLFLSIRLGFLQFVKLPFILKNTIGKSFGQKTEKGKFSGWQAVTGALASTLGAGNIIGTAMAIAFGGPGGVFWLWVAVLAACIVKYTKVVMAIVGIEALINYLDFVLFLTIFFNLIGVYWHNQEVVDLTKEYFADPDRWETEKWPARVALEEKSKTNE